MSWGEEKAYDLRLYRNMFDSIDVTERWKTAYSRFYSNGARPFQTSAGLFIQVFQISCELTKLISKHGKNLQNAFVS